jgi:ATP-dependent exoDNAse (exonuclease V) alpha subunit
MPGPRAGHPQDFPSLSISCLSAFAMTINKSQGQTLNNVGVYLPSSIFYHGQLYVAISQATSNVNIKIFNGQGPDGYMWNVVYREVLEM